jgi:hypothetical protein
MANYIQIINNYGELYRKMENLSLAGGISTCQHRKPLCWRTSSSVLAGGHLRAQKVIFAQTCWRVVRPPTKTGFSRQDNSFLA